MAGTTHNFFSRSISRHCAFKASDGRDAHKIMKHHAANAVLVMALALSSRKIGRRVIEIDGAIMLPLALALEGVQLAHRPDWLSPCRLRGSRVLSTSSTAARTRRACSGASSILGALHDLGDVVEFDLIKAEIADDWHLRPWPSAFQPHRARILVLPVRAVRLEVIRRHLLEGGCLAWRVIWRGYFPPSRDGAPRLDRCLYELRPAASLASSRASARPTAF